ncbi:MAG: hypothetical protein AB1778_09860 [Candidatus Bipolaricaulota bacterium]
MLLVCRACASNTDIVFLLDVTSSMVGEVKGNPLQENIIGSVVNALSSEVRDREAGSIVLLTFSVGPCDLDGPGTLGSAYYVQRDGDRGYLLKLLEGERGAAASQMPLYGGAIPETWLGVAAALEGMRSATQPRFWGLNTGILLTLQCALDIMTSLQYAGGDPDLVIKVLDLVTEVGAKAQDALDQERHAAESPGRARQYEEAAAASWAQSKAAEARIDSLLDQARGAAPAAAAEYARTHRQELVILTDGDENVEPIGSSSFPQRAQEIVERANGRFAEMNQAVHVWRYVFGSTGTAPDAIGEVLGGHPIYTSVSADARTFGEQHSVKLAMRDIVLDVGNLWDTGETGVSTLAVADVSRVGETSVDTGRVDLVVSGFDIPGVAVLLEPSSVAAAQVLHGGGSFEFTMRFSPLSDLRRYLSAAESSGMTELVGALQLSYAAGNEAPIEVVFDPSATTLHLPLSVPHVQGSLIRTDNGFSLLLTHNQAYERLPSAQRHVRIVSRDRYVSLVGQPGSPVEALELPDASGQVMLTIRRDLPPGQYAGLLEIEPAALDPLDGLGWSSYGAIPYEFILLEPDRDGVQANLWTPAGGRTSDDTVSVSLPAIYMMGAPTGVVGPDGLAASVSESGVAGSGIAIRLQKAAYVDGADGRLELALDVSPYALVEAQSAALNTDPTDATVIVQGANASGAVFFRQSGEIHSCMRLGIDLAYLPRAIMVELRQLRQGPVLPGGSAVALDVHYPDITSVGAVGALQVKLDQCYPTTPMLADAANVHSPQDIRSGVYIVTDSCEAWLVAPALETGVYREECHGVIHVEAAPGSWVVLPGGVPVRTCDIPFSFAVEVEQPQLVVAIDPGRLSFANPWTVPSSTAPSVQVESDAQVHVICRDARSLDGKITLTLQDVPPELGHVSVLPSAIEGPFDTDRSVAVVLAIPRAALARWEGAIASATLILEWQGSPGSTTPVQLKVGGQQGTAIMLPLSVPTARPGILVSIEKPLGQASGTRIDLGDVAEGQRVMELSLEPDTALVAGSKCIEIEYDHTELTLVESDKSNVACGPRYIVFEIAANAPPGEQTGTLRLLPVEPVQFLNGERELRVAYAYRLTAPAVSVTAKLLPGLHNPGDVIARLQFEPNYAFLQLPMGRRLLVVGGKGQPMEFLQAESQTAEDAGPGQFVLSGRATVLVRLPSERAAIAGTYRHSLTAVFPGIEYAWTSESALFRIRSPLTAAVARWCGLIALALYSATVLAAFVYAAVGLSRGDIAWGLARIGAAEHKGVILAVLVLVVCAMVAIGLVPLLA